MLYVWLDLFDYCSDIGDKLFAFACFMFVSAQSNVPYFGIAVIEF